MSLTFADTYNMVAYLNKSDASEGFNQVIDFLTGSHIKYALTVNPTIYMSCIKQFWNTVVVKQSNDVTRLQALVDKKKVLITEAVIRDVLRLDDADGVDCLPNEEIFAELTRMGYEKPSTMASAVICLSTGRKFNFSKYIFESLVRNVNSSSKFYMYPRFIQLMIQNQLAEELEEQGDAEEQIQGNDNDADQGANTAVLGDDVQDQFIPSPTPPTPPPQPPQDIPSTSQKLEKANKVKALKLRRLRKVGTSQRIESSADTDMEDASNQGRMIADLDRDKVKGRQAEIYQIDMDHASKVLSMQEDEPEVQEAVEVVTTTKLITEVVVANTIPLNKFDSQIPPPVEITPDLSITDSRIMEDEHLDTILEMKSDEEYDSSVKDLNLTP
nr:hypothetical protein [Tanacetum cinerariifolium]